MQIEYRDRTQLCRCLEKKVLVDRMIQISRSFATFKGSSIQKYIDKSEPPRASIIYLPHLPATRAVSGVLYKKLPISIPSIALVSLTPLLVDCVIHNHHH